MGLPAAGGAPTASARRSRGKVGNREWPDHRRPQSHLVGQWDGDQRTLPMPTAAKKATASGANPAEALSHLAGVTDRMHAMLMEMGCTENSSEEVELAALTDVLEAYERQRWPLGRISGAKG
jgi:hypothetical protein